MPKRRARGDGSLYFDQANNFWVARIDTGIDPASGKRMQRKISGRTRADAARKLREIARQRDDGIPVPTGMSFGDLLERWMESLVTTGKLQPDTIQNYRYMADNHLHGLTGKQARDLTVLDIEEILRNLAEQGYARSTLVRVRNVASQAFQWGIRRRFINWNPAAIADIPTVNNDGERAIGRRARRSMTRDEAQQFLVAASEHRLNAAFVLAMCVGLRPGELTSLAWSSVDLDDKCIFVCEAWRGSGRNRHRGDPKTRDARRVISLPSIAIDALRKHRVQQRKERVGVWPLKYRYLVFVTSKGTPIDPSNLRKQIAGVARRAGIEWKVTPYDLRHTATSLLADAGVSNERLADFLRHRTTKMVEFHYRHVIGEKVRAAEMMSEIFEHEDETSESAG